jgi:hypothetical protein
MHINLQEVENNRPSLSVVVLNHERRGYVGVVTTRQTHAEDDDNNSIACVVPTIMRFTVELEFKFLTVIIYLAEEVVYRSVLPALCAVLFVTFYRYANRLFPFARYSNNVVGFVLNIIRRRLCLL